MPLLQRRKFLTSLVATLAAPAVVRATSLMPIKALPPVLEYRQLSPSQLDALYIHANTSEDLLRVRLEDIYRITARAMDKILYEDDGFSLGPGLDFFTSNRTN
jgi:hypothetical protein